MNKRMTKKRCNNQCLLYVSLGALILWFYVMISFIAVLERKLLEVKHENSEYNEKLKEFVAASELKRRRRQGDELPQYPINHRHLNNVIRPLSDQAIYQCHKALWHTVDTTAYVLPNNESFVITGDIQDLWLRDSAAQIHPLLLPNTYNGQSLVQVDQKLERIVSGLILKTARLIRFDPYANAFRLEERKTPVTKFQREALGRHGYIATWNYELDSACYFLRMLFFFHESFPNHPVLKERQVKEAATIMMDVWIAEQRHEEDAYPSGELFDCVHCGKPYRYNPAELKRKGKGTMTNSSAGLTWTGFRPSDDPCVYGYLIPANMFAVVTLGYVVKLAAVVWDDESMVEKARKLRREIDDGIQKYGIVEHPTHGRIYAYEVDGLGNYLLMDDANVPSLLSIPYLGYDYDPTIFANTKRFLFSKDNPMFHEGRHDGIAYAGIGSPHTKFIPSSIWPMAMIMEGLVSNNATHKVVLVEKLLASSAGTGWMHESFNPNNPAKFSRPWFCWPDSLFAELVMSLTEACPRPEGGGYSIKEWTDRDDAAHVVRGSVFMKPTPSPTPPPPTPMPQPLPLLSLAVVSECTRAGEGARNGGYVDASFSNKRSFCEKWNATCVLSDMTRVDGDDGGVNPFIAKWQLINRTLHETHADWIMWLDCEAAFTNLDIDWRYHLNGHLDNSKALLASRDKNGVNLGVLLMSKSRGISFVSTFQEWLRAKEDDQAALKEMLKNRPAIQRDIFLVPLEKINSYIDNPDGHKWKPNEWIVHQVWCQNAQKCASHFLLILKDVAERISNADSNPLLPLPLL